MNAAIEFKLRRRKRRPKPTLKTEATKTIKLLITTLSIMIAILGVAFLATTNESAQKGYALQQEKLKNEYLKNLNSNLTTKITEVTAFTQIKTNNKITDMEQIEEKNYVTSEDNSVY